MPLLNQDLGFDEVRWAISRRVSYDSGLSFVGSPNKTRLSQGTHLFRLVHMMGAHPFDGVWWMPKQVFEEILRDANQAQHGGGALFRNYVAEALALPSGSYQLNVIEIELTQDVYAWAGRAARLFGRPGGVEQVFLPNLPAPGSPRDSLVAKLVHSYWLKF